MCGQSAPIVRPAINFIHQSSASHDHTKYDPDAREEKLSDGNLLFNLRFSSMTSSIHSSQPSGRIQFTDMMMTVKRALRCWWRKKDKQIIFHLRTSYYAPSTTFENYVLFRVSRSGGACATWTSGDAKSSQRCAIISTSIFWFPHKYYVRLSSPASVLI